MRTLPKELVARAARLFWDVDVATLDPVLHEDFIIGRVLVEGTWNDIQAVRQEVGDEGLAAFCRRAGHRLDRRTRRFFEVVLGLEPGTCEKTSWRSASGPLFTP